MKEYVIKQGEHYSNHELKLYLGKKSFKITFQFDETARYDLGDIDQLDINKLCGVSFGSHEINSIRIGWNYNLFTDKIDLFSYVYENGVRIYNKIGECFIGEVVTLQLELNFNAKCFWIHKDNYSIYNDYKFPFLKVGYYLYPYFGGNKPAPHDIKIKLDVI